MMSKAAARSYRSLVPSCYHAVPVEDRLEDFLVECLELPTSERPRVVAAFCAEHPELAEELRTRLVWLEAQGLDDESTSSDASGSRAAFGEFVVGEEIGRGGMGVVYEAYQPSLQRRVALKVLPPRFGMSVELVERFRREAAAAATLQHRGIVDVYSVGERDGQHYFAMELVEGTPLDRVLARLRASGKQVETLDSADWERASRAGDDNEAKPTTKRRSDWQRRSGYIATVVQTCIEIANALEHAHEAGIVHRDVKPANIILRVDGTPVLTDFGLARVESDTALSRSGSFLGTPHYVSPEQAMANRVDVDGRSDLFSLGAMMYELLTLQVCFDGASQHEILGKILAKEPKDPIRLNPRLPLELAAIVLKCLEKDPDRRYETAQALSEDLRAFLEFRPVTARRPGAGTRLRRWMQREPALATAVFAAASFLVVGIALASLYARQVVMARDRAIADADEIRRLSDAMRIRELELEEPKLWPLTAATRGRLDSWLADSAGVVARRPLHEAALAKIRVADATKTDEGALARWQSQVLTTVLQGLDGLATLRERVIHDRDASLEADLVANDSAEARETWNACIDAIASDPKYGRMRLQPVPRLLPLGPDPESKLWEFWHVRSGSRPRVDAKGRHVVGEDSGLVFVLLPGGSFTMGSSPPGAGGGVEQNVDRWHEPNEAPPHIVKLGAFFVSKYEVTQGQWLRLTGTNPSKHANSSDKAKAATSLAHPVDTVSWFECEQVSHRYGLTLPTEAQWEYACRAGTSSVWCHGDAIDDLQGKDNFADASLRAQTDTLVTEDRLDDQSAFQSVVGSYVPNRFGLFDMHGNVSEWCLDAFCDYEVDPDPDTGLREAEGGSKSKIVRGGSYYFPPTTGRSARRWADLPADRYSNIGVRLALAVPYR